jgi:hypothetical protein
MGSYAHLAELTKVKEHFHSSLAHMPAYSGLKFIITRVEKVHNTELETQFYASLEFFHKQGYNQDHAIHRLYHGTLPTNIPDILRNNLSMTKKGQLDPGWFGAGLYFSQHADYVMQYKTTGSFRRVVAGDQGTLLQFDTLPGRVRTLAKLEMAGQRLDYTDSNVTPNGYEHVLFDNRHVLPRYVIHFEVRSGSGAKFDGSLEQMGPSHASSAK